MKSVGWLLLDDILMMQQGICPSPRNVPSPEDRDVITKVEAEVAGGAWRLS